MAHVEINQRIAVNAELHLEHDLVNRAGRDVARHQVPVRRVHIFKEVPRLAVAIGPHASTLAANRLRDQPILVLALHCGGMHLDELAIGVGRARPGSSALTADPVFTSDCVERPKTRPGPPVATSAAVGRETRASRASACRSQQIPRQFRRLVLHDAQHLPAFELAHQAGRLIAADLLVECVQQLLPGGRARECGAMMLGAAETAEVEQAFGRAIEHHAHPIEQVDDRRRRLAHRLDRRLMRQEVAAVNRIVKVNPSANRPRLWC